MEEWRERERGETEARDLRTNIKSWDRWKGERQRRAEGGERGWRRDGRTKIVGEREADRWTEKVVCSTLLRSKT
jgi:hypothetical protein